MSFQSGKVCCIASETMSLVLDEEYTFSTAELTHLKSCDNCRQRFGKFQKTHLILTENWRVPTGGFSTASIRNGVHRRLAAEKHLHSLRRLVAFSAAALFLMVCGAVLYNGVILPAVTPRPHHYATTAPATADEAARYPYYYGRPTIANNHSPFQRRSAQNAALPVTMLSPVNADNVAGNQLVNCLSGVIPGAADVFAKVDPEVRHVWATGSNGAVSALEKVVSRLGIEDRCAIEASPDGVVRLTAHGITKGELLRLVRQADWLGLKLLSSQQPQPESVIVFSNEGDAVDYYMTVVPVE